METYLWGVATMLVGAIAWVAYEHNEAYNLYFHPMLTLVLIIAFSAIMGFNYGVMYSKLALTGAATGVDANASAQMKAIATLEFNPIWIFLIAALYFFLFVLSHLSRLGITPRK